MQTVWAVLDHLAGTLQAQLPWVVGLSVLFTALSLFKSQTGSPGRPWWKSRDLLVDAQYCFIMPLIAPYVKLTTLLLAAAALHGAMSDAEVTDYITHGRGPVSLWPTWVQVGFYVIVTDLLLYWVHRTFHKAVLWPFHAVHHSSLDVDWTTTYRAHPINLMLGSGLVSTIMILVGVPPAIMIALVPFDQLSAAFVHANLNWTLGPLKTIIATPVFHRWHHTSPAEGGDSNFAPTFAIWDWLFGTFYMPEGQLPVEFGVDDPHFPHDWIGQMVVPFQQFFERINTVSTPGPSQDPSQGPSQGVPK